MVLVGEGNMLKKEKKKRKRVYLQIHTLSEDELVVVGALILLSALMPLAGLRKIIGIIHLKEAIIRPKTWRKVPTNNK